MLRVIFEERKILNSSGSLKNQLKMMYIFLVIIFLLTLIGGLIFITESKKPKISVIVPVYNTEKYLDECLNSVENQTLKDIEIICVNDGSTDKSLEILNNHAGKDSRIKVIDKENGGVSKARNAGMKIAKGEYITFLDSDDLLSPIAYEKMYDLAKVHKPEVVKCEVLDFFEGNPIESNLENYDDSKVKVFEVETFQQDPYSQLNYDNGVVWNKIYSRKFLLDNDLLFNEKVALAEDSMFNWLCGASVKKQVITYNILYFYRINRPGSIMSDNYRNLKKRFDGYSECIKSLGENRERFKFDDSDKWLVSTMTSLAYSHLKESEEKSDSMLPYYASEFNKLIDEFIKKYGVEVSNEDSKIIECIKEFAGI